MQNTFSISATDPDSNNLTYSVNWGEEATYDAPTATMQSSASSFTHTYYRRGNYVVTFTVSDGTSSAVASMVINIR